MNPEIYAHLHAGEYDRAHALLARGALPKPQEISPNSTWTTAGRFSI